MSRYDDFRAPYGGGGGRGGGGGGGPRWDRETFTRERERDRFGGPPPRAPVLEREPPRFAERRAPERFEDTYFREEKYGPPARRPGGYYDEVDRFEERDRFVERSPRGPTAGAMVPFDRERRDPNDFPGGRRPGLLRRQSSLDTFDRRPQRRFDDFEAQEYRRQAEPIPVALPPRGRPEPIGLERDFEDIRIAEPDYYGDEEYRQYKEREWTTRRRPSRPAGGPRFSPPESEAFEEVIEEEKPFPRRGKTRMGRRLAHPRALVELGYPFEEEGDVMIILKALGKENIDEVVALSRQYRDIEIRELESKEITKTTYLIEGPGGPPGEETIIKERIIATSPPSEIPRSVREWDMLKVERSPSPGGRTARSGRSARSRRRSSPGTAFREEIIEKKEIVETREVSRSPSRTVRSSRSRRRSSPSVVIERREIIEDDRDESSSFHAGPLAIVAPDRHHRSKTDREIKEEIRRLETERKLLRDERRVHRRIREGSEAELIIEREPTEVIEVRKDRKAPNPRVIKAMLATLT